MEGSRRVGSPWRYRLLRPGWPALVMSVSALFGLGMAGCDGCKDKGTAASTKATLVIASYGGAWQAAQKATMFAPYASAASVEVRDVVYNGQYARIAEMVRAGHVEWDVVDVEGNMVVRGAQEGILEPIDYSIVERAGLIDGATHSHGVGVVAWSWVLAYRSGSLTPAQAQQPWQVFFDPEAVPGARGLRNDPRRVLEIALLADGVGLEQLYPLDVDRAFTVLTRFRDAMRLADQPIVWWDEYAQPPQLLRDKEVVMSPAANGRIAEARAKGAPLDFTWVQGILDLDWWVVPRGTKHKTQAMRFIAFATSAEAQAAMVQRIAYGPIRSAALAHVPKERASQLPTFPANLQEQIEFDTEWWAKNLEPILTRWNAWRTGA